MAQPSTLADMRYDSTEMNIDELRSSSLNPRQQFDPEALNELAADIQAHGIIEPIIVRPVPNDPGVYEIVAGERRYRAAQSIGLRTVPVRMASRSVTDAESLELALAENVKRSDLNPIERAQGYERLALVSGMQQQQVAELVGRSVPSVSNSMRLLKLPAPVRQQIANGELSEWHGVQLARFADWPAVCEQIAALAIERKTPSKDLETSLPFARDLVKSGLAFEVPSDLPFAAQLQKDKAGYFKAAPGSTSGYYLNRERYQTLKAEAETAAKARAEDSKLRALGKPTPTVKKGQNPARRLPMLDEMPGESYIRLDADGAIPEGCSEECPCRGRGLLSDGSTAVAICVDKRRYNRLSKATEKGEEKRLLAQHQMLDQWLDDHTRMIEAFSGTELAVIFGRSLQWLGVPVQKALAQLGLELPDVPIQSDAFLNWLAHMEPGTLLKLAFASALREELNGDGGMRRDMSVTRWYLTAIGEGMPEPPVEAPTATETDATAEDDSEAADETEEGAEGVVASEEWPPVDASEAEAVAV